MSVSIYENRINVHIIRFFDKRAKPAQNVSKVVQDPAVLAGSRLGQKQEQMVSRRWADNRNQALAQKQADRFVRLHCFRSPEM